jgi:magnesium-transporting ATPase (P-type)
MSILIQSNLAWHTEPTAEVLRELQTSSHGLSSEEAQQRLAKFGPNLLPEKGPDALWRIIVRQFASPLIYILLAAAIVSLAMGDFKDAGFIAAVLLINAVIGAYQEAQAEKSSHALRKLLRIRALVERQGEVREMPAEFVVPGDVIWLESGNRIPADLRLISSQGLEIDESLLTGESLAVQKNSDWLGEPATTLAERQNMAFAGSIVTRGRARGVVVGTGTATHVGQLALDMFVNTDGKPPLIQRMEKFTNQVAVLTLGAAILIGAVGVLVWNYSLLDTFFLIVALAVSAIPEGLPVAITVALAVATSRMARRNVIVRRLTAVEGLGSCTLIATDKTGTLTCNELTVREIQLPSGEVFRIEGQGFNPEGRISAASAMTEAEIPRRLESLGVTGVLCNEAELFLSNDQWRWHGDAVDVALLSLGRKLGLVQQDLIEEHPQINAIPFESERQFAVTFHRHGNIVRAHVKGAPERILQMCTSLTPVQRRQLEAKALSMAQRGLRVLGIASGTAPANLTPADMPTFPDQLELLGFVGIIDPLREGAKESVAACQRAGVGVAMITGDHRVTALAIARELGLAEHESQVMTGDELSQQDPADLSQIIRDMRVFARVTPRQKLEIVNAARQAGHFVAVTGDGVNDAPALRAANIGVAMGRMGTDVAREAAELVITDDNFRSIVSGIEEGRIAYNNIRNVILLLVSAGAAELLMVLLAILSGLPIPLLPLQLLWLNLVTDGIQGVALAFEPGDHNDLKRNPRPPGEPLFNQLMMERMAISVSVMGLGGFLVYLIALKSGWSIESARNLLMLTMVLFEIVHIGNCRSEVQSAFTRSPLQNPVLFFGSLAAFLLHLLGMHWSPLQSTLKAEPVSLNAWIVAIGVSLLVLPGIEIHKWYLRKNNRPKLTDLG